MNEQSWLEGVISVQAALEANSRPIMAVYIRQDKWDGGVRRLQQTAVAANIPTRRLAAAEIDALASGSSHGGVLAQVGPRRFAPLEALGVGTQRPFIVMLDGVEDPFNFGQAVRALYAAGADGLVVRPRNWLSAAATVARASAGASERMVMAIAETAVDAAAYFHRQGFTVACTAQEQATSIYEADLRGPLFLLIGGEKRGITRSFLDQADLRLQIPYGRLFAHSLGTVAAASIVAFERFRQTQTQGAG